MNDSPPVSIAIGDSVIYQELQDELVLLNMANQRYYGLDDVGSLMWKLLIQHGTTEDVIRAMRESYDVDEQTVRRDLHDLVASLVDAGLLKVGDGSPGYL